MARVYMVVDDLDNDIKADGSIEFTFDGFTYYLDLCDDNIKRFRETLQPYLDAAHARKPVRGRNSKPGPPQTERDQRHQEIREWGRDNGFEVADRGRPPGEVVQAWRRAHANSA